METFVEIINSAKVRSNSNLVISGIQANKNAWNEYTFYPNKGVVGVIIGEARSFEGTIFLVQCGTAFSFKRGVYAGLYGKNP